MRGTLPLNAASLILLRYIDRGAQGEPKGGQKAKAQSSPKQPKATHHGGIYTQRSRQDTRKQTALEQRTTKSDHSTRLLVILGGHLQALQPSMATSTGIMLHTTTEDAIVTPLRKMP